MTRSIEFHFFLFGLVCNFVWEMLQMPLFAFPADRSLAEINLTCLQASAGDAMMLVVMFWIAAAMVKSRAWIFHLNRYRITLFLAPGIVMTVVFEALATGSLNRWLYGKAMPTLPVLGTGIVPIAQWLVIPLLVLWLVRKRLA
ncbi:MAG: hypothetical protein FD165_2275 [Gammaproteobacteria bacterium]|nr:MAG: hypothetical protein FD165_2275 [Gammaproteobacteria bacterium]TND02649.1 MAG: hypothetical protein FD120_2110 [Gammaproteobacteria bacterium]